jgi:cation transport ATPase
MPEGMNVEISRKLSEQEEEEEEEEKKKKKKKSKTRWDVLVEIVEVAVLAIVAIATTWSGYQSARWDGQQSLLYGYATADRFKAHAASTLGGQELTLDSSIFTAYLQAHAAGDSKLEMLYVRRFTPDYRVASWPG